MKITIKVHDKKELPILVTQDLKIKQLKKLLEEVVGFNMNEKFIVFEGMILREHETLQELGIQEFCTIHLCDNLLPLNLRKSVKILVLIKIEDGSEIPAIIANNMMIGELLKIIQPSIGNHSDEKYLYFEGKLLNLEKTLIEQGIQHSSTIHLSYRLESSSSLNKQQTIVIYIKICSGEKLHLTVFRTIKVKELQKSFEEIYNLDISESQLKFNDKVLAYEKTLEEIGISNLSELSLSKRF